MAGVDVNKGGGDSSDWEHLFSNEPSACTPQCSDVCTSALSRVYNDSKGSEA